MLALVKHLIHCNKFVSLLVGGVGLFATCSPWPFCSLLAFAFVAFGFMKSGILMGLDTAH